MAEKKENLEDMILLKNDNQPAVLQLPESKERENKEQPEETLAQDCLFLCRQDDIKLWLKRNGYLSKMKIAYPTYTGANEDDLNIIVDAATAKVLETEFKKLKEKDPYYLYWKRDHVSRNPAHPLMLNTFFNVLIPVNHYVELQSEANERLNLPADTLEMPQNVNFVFPQLYVKNYRKLLYYVHNIIQEFSKDCSTDFFKQLFARYKASQYQLSRLSDYNDNLPPLPQHLESDAAFEQFEKDCAKTGIVFKKDGFNRYRRPGRPEPTVNFHVVVNYPKFIAYLKQVIQNHLAKENVFMDEKEKLEFTQMSNTFLKALFKMENIVKVDQVYPLGIAFKDQFIQEIMNGEFEEDTARVWLKNILRKEFDCFPEKFEAISATHKFDLLSKVFVKALDMKLFGELQSVILAEMEVHADQWVVERQCVLLNDWDLKKLEEYRETHPKEQYDLWEQIVGELQSSGLLKAADRLKARMDALKPKLAPVLAAAAPAPDANPILFLAPGLQQQAAGLQQQAAGQLVFQQQQPPGLF